VCFKIRNFRNRGQKTGITFFKTECYWLRICLQFRNQIRNRAFKSVTGQPEPDHFAALRDVPDGLIKQVVGVNSVLAGGINAVLAGGKLIKTYHRRRRRPAENLVKLSVFTQWRTKWRTSPIAGLRSLPISRIPCCAKTYENLRFTKPGTKPGTKCGVRNTRAQQL